MSLKASRKALQHNDGENSVLEPFTPSISKGSFMTMDNSEQVPSSACSPMHPSLDQGMTSSQLMQEKHMMTLIKMIEAILILMQQ